MTWFTAAVLIVVAIALVVARHPLARMQDMVVGARGGPGCVIAEAVALILLALAIILLTPDA